MSCLGNAAPSLPIRSRLLVLVTSSVVFAETRTTTWVGNIGSDSISIIDVDDIDDDSIVDEVLFNVKPMCAPTCVPGQICADPPPLTPCINGPHDIAFSPNGDWAYITAYHGDKLVVMDARTLRLNPPTAPVFASRANAGDRPQGVAVSSDGLLTFVVNSSSNNVQVFETDLGLALSLTTVPVENDPNGIAITPDDEEVWVTNNGSDSVSVIETTGYTVIHTIENVGDAPRKIVIGNIPGKGLRAYTVNAYGDSVTAIDMATYALVDEDGVENPIDLDDEPDPDPQTSLPRGIALHPDLDRLYATEHETAQITRISTDDHAKATPIMLEIAGPHRIAITPAGDKAYIAHPDFDVVSILNTLTDTMVEDEVTVQNGPGSTTILKQIVP